MNSEPSAGDQCAKNGGDVRAEGLAGDGRDGQVEQAGAAAGDWLFDPFLLDGALQAVLAWARAIHGRGLLPTAFGRVIRLVEEAEAHRADVPEGDQALLGALLEPDAKGARQLLELAVGLLEADEEAGLALLGKDPEQVLLCDFSVG